MGVGVIFIYIFLFIFLSSPLSILSVRMIACVISVWKS